MKNKLLLVSFILGLVYSIYLILFFTGAIGSSNGAEQAGAALATVLVMPHMIVTMLATLFNGLGYFLNKRGFALTGGILYTVAILFMPIYFMFVIVEAILSFIGFTKLEKGVS